MDQSPLSHNEPLALFQATCLAVATIIGGGVLALPVSLYQTSLTTFFILFTFSLLGQIAVVTATTDLLERANISEYGSGNPKESKISMYSLSAKYLPEFLQGFFNLMSLVLLMSMLSEYGLAGPKAAWEMVSDEEAPSIIFVLYWILGASTAVFFMQAILPILTGLTVVKGSLFILVILIVQFIPKASTVSWDKMFAPVYISNETSSALTRAASPFLVSCVALGGLPFTIMVTYKQFLPYNPTENQIRNYRNANILALIVCYVINIFWVISIFQVQFYHPSFRNWLTKYIFCLKKVVPRNILTEAKLSGQISTTPLIIEMKKIMGNTNSYQVVRRIIDALILASTCVSFFVLSVALRTYLDDMSSKFGVFDRLNISQESRKWVAYTSAFGTILIFTLTHTDQFQEIMEHYVSLAINVQCGLLMFIMLFNCRSGKYKNRSILNENSEEVEHRRNSVKNENVPVHYLPRWLTAIIITIFAPFFFLATMAVVLTF